jgi:hypothetical protein
MPRSHADEAQNQARVSESGVGSGKSLYDVSRAYYLTCNLLGSNPTAGAVVVLGGWF